MHKLLVLVFAIVGCNAGVLHHGYTGYNAHIQSAPVIQQYVAEQEQHIVPQHHQVLSYAVESPLVYAAADVAPVAEKKVPVMRRRQMRKQKPQPQQPESFSYQIRVQHAEQPQPEPGQNQNLQYQEGAVEEVQGQEQQEQYQPLLQHYEYQPLQTYQIQPLQQIQLEAPKPVQVQKQRPQVRRPQKTARIQSIKSIQTPTKAKTLDLTTVQIPQIGDLQYTYTPIVYYYPGVTAGHPGYPVQNNPIQPQRPQPQPEEDEAEDSELETLDRYQVQGEEQQEEEEEEEEDSDDDYDSEIVVARVQPQQKFARARTITQKSSAQTLGMDSALLAYQQFTANW